MKKNKRNPNVDSFSNYLLIVAIVPAVFSIIAYELLEYIVNVGFGRNPNYNPLIGLGMLIPMGLMMELLTFFLSRSWYRKLSFFIHAINQVAGGNYDTTLTVAALKPFDDVAENFNQMTSELRSVETLRNDFINDFSHEFNTPITSINGFANLLLDTEVTEEERMQYLTVIADESERLATLSKETLMMSRLDSQQTIIDKDSYSLDEQIKQIIILLSQSWSAKQINLETDLSPIIYLGNANLMSHIWINIINNAVKFTPIGGNISVSMKQLNGIISIVISDTGKGMSEDELRQIFNKYYQADSSHSTKGLGLGLSIAHRIVELCGGNITVTSNRGKGTAFTVSLPSSQD